MSRLLVYSLAFSSILVAGCGDPACAYGPSELRDESFTAEADAPIDGFVAYGDIDGSVFTAVSTEDAPSGVELSLEDGGVAIGGSIAEAGTYAFTVLVEAEAGDVCAEWARYDVTLTVE